jgi:MOSC domain-containing protein YiiM
VYARVLRPGRIAIGQPVELGEDSRGSLLAHDSEERH